MCKVATEMGFLLNELAEGRQIKSLPVALIAKVVKEGLIEDKISSTKPWVLTQAGCDRLSNEILSKAGSFIPDTLEPKCAFIS